MHFRLVGLVSGMEGVRGLEKMTNNYQQYYEEVM